MPRAWVRCSSPPPRRRTWSACSTGAAAASRRSSVAPAPRLPRWPRRRADSLRRHAGVDVAGVELGWTPDWRATRLRLGLPLTLEVPRARTRPSRSTTSPPTPRTRAPLQAKFRTGATDTWAWPDETRARDLHPRGHRPRPRLQADRWPAPRRPRHATTARSSTACSTSSPPSGGRSTARRSTSSFPFWQNATRPSSSRSHPDERRRRGRSCGPSSRHTAAAR